MRFFQNIAVVWWLCYPGFLGGKKTKQEKLEASRDTRGEVGKAGNKICELGHWKPMASELLSKKGQHRRGDSAMDHALGAK